MYLKSTETTMKFLSKWGESEMFFQHSEKEISDSAPFDIYYSQLLTKITQNHLLLDIQMLQKSLTARIKAVNEI